MRFLWSSIVAIACAAAGVSAQSTETKTKTETKIEVKDGKEVTVTGCVAAHPGQSGYALSNVTEKDRRLGNYILVGDTDDVDEHVGHLVEIRGRVADQKDGRIEVETTTEIERDNAEDSKTESKTEVKGDLKGLPYLSVEDVRTIRRTCS